MNSIYLPRWKSFRLCSASDIFNCDDKEQNFTVTMFGVASLASGVWKFTLRVGGKGQTLWRGT